MTHQCRQCARSFEISTSDLERYDQLSPIVGKTKLGITPPKLCPECRKQRRLSYRNERKLYHRKCDKCQKEVISIYAVDKPYVVYCLSCWWSDRHSPTDFGQAYDFTRPFFVQFEEVLKRTPLPALISSPDAEENNCSYINFAGNSKNCYMTFDADFNEDSYYSNVLKHSRNCMECSYVQTSELCYEVIVSTGCYHLFFSEECTNCRDSYFLKNCIDCKDCLLCVNLNHKQYCIMNQQYTKEQYEEYMKKIDLGDRKMLATLEKEFVKLVQTTPCKFIHGVNLENCSGDYMINAKNAEHCFTVGDVEDIKYCDSLYRAKDCMDVSSFGEKMTKCYDTVSSGINVYDLQFCQVCASDASSLQYNYGSRVAKNSFGCVALKSNQYCILNKQYSQEEYEALVPKIFEHMKTTGEWGEFFPITISPFAYNESVVNEYFPLEKEDALRLGAKWREDDVINRYEGPKVTVPENIKDTTDEVLKQIFSCSHCQKNYKIISQELKFYRDQTLPLPTHCFSCRTEKRFSKKNPQALWNRQCAECHAPFQTSYAPNRPERVLCELCYLKVVY